jgi:hypothetical protein
MVKDEKIRGRGHTHTFHGGRRPPAESDRLQSPQTEETTLRNAPTWKTLVRDVIERLPRTFTLRDVEAYREFFAKNYPDNRFIEAKIRQSLQILRDQGFIAFKGAGHYERTGATQPTFSPFFDPSVAENYVSGSQVARVTVETWAEHNLYCLNCPTDELGRLPANTKVADLECCACNARYQVKGKNGRFGGKITGAAYEPLVNAVRGGLAPNYLLVEYDPRFSIVVFVSGIPGLLITEDLIVPRKPLAPTARRAGWQGCNVHIQGLKQVRIVQPAGLERGLVREQWANTR